MKHKHAYFALVSQGVTLRKLHIDTGLAKALLNALALLEDGYSRASEPLDDNDVAALLAASIMEEYRNVCDRNDIRR